MTAERPIGIATSGDSGTRSAEPGPLRAGAGRLLVEHAIGKPELGAGGTAHPSEQLGFRHHVLVHGHLHTEAVESAARRHAVACGSAHVKSPSSTPSMITSSRRSCQRDVEVLADPRSVGLRIASPQPSIHIIHPASATSGAYSSISVEQLDGGALDLASSLSRRARSALGGVLERLDQQLVLVSKW